MEIRHLKYFLAVAEELNFSKAADRLSISQPPLSRQIKALEQEVQARLFERNNKRVALTDAGRYFETEIRQFLGSLEKAIAKTREISANHSGDFRIAYISSTFSGTISKLVQYLSTQYPHVNFKLYEVPTARQVTALELGKLDLGILRAPVFSAKTQTKRWFTDHFSLVYRKGSFQIKSEKDVEGLKDATFVFFNKDYAPHYYDALLEICAFYGFVPNVVHESNNVNSIIQLVKNGMGVSIVPSSVSKNHVDDEIGFLELKYASLSTEVLLATPRDVTSEITSKAVSYLLGQ